ncbi:hypothetical protein CYMTET_25488 [Cymbomonas tetramitiformis]|uniref:Uncharacterized protein n=1 Tax=Cymbomonas tetramitiformis TaxID=36881 RepID=A0AAE0FU38_9CHLO|nr:hypothetical protein CYMTET_25488 [Cymbomonas tetramitiformis]
MTGHSGNFACTSEESERVYETASAKGLRIKLEEAFSAEVLEISAPACSQDFLKTSISQLAVTFTRDQGRTTFQRSVILKEVDILKNTYRDEGHRFMSSSSFAVEASVYRTLAPQLNALEPAIKVPQAFLVNVTEEETKFEFCIEDLSESPWRCQHAALGLPQMKAAVRWLAAMHAFNWGTDAARKHGLWAVGAYWTLDKREGMEDRWHVGSVVIADRWHVGSKGSTDRWQVGGMAMVD